MRRLALIVAATALLTVPPSAEAKGLKWVKVCGPDDCTKVSGEGWDYERMPLIFPPKVMSGRPDPAPTVDAPWFRVIVALPHSNGERARSVVAPEIKYVGGKDGSFGYVWEKLKPRYLNTYLQLSEGLTANPAETMPGDHRRR